MSNAHPIPVFPVLTAAEVEEVLAEIEAQPRVLVDPIHGRIILDPIYLDLGDRDEADDLDAALPAAPVDHCPAAAVLSSPVNGPAKNGGTGGQHHVDHPSGVFVMHLPVWLARPAALVAHIKGLLFNLRGRIQQHRAAHAPAKVVREAVDAHRPQV